MQLASVRTRLGIATCSLLQITASLAHADGAWKTDTAVLYYAEGDGRVSALEPGVNASTETADGGKLSIHAVMDVLTGATPNGAHASSVVQTFTTPSGESSYTVGPGITPLDTTFMDTRFAFGVDWERPITRLTRVVWGANLSSETDYTSLGVSANYQLDLNNKNTTLTAGLAFNDDTISPQGGVPVAFGPMRFGALNRDGSDRNKTTSDILLGVTQVLSRSTLVQLNFTSSSVSGYQNDPYKILTVVDPVTGLPTTSGLANVNADALPYVYEKRPDTRRRNSVFFKLAQHLNEDVIDFSYRSFRDDWDIRSRTLDLRYRYELGHGAYLQPHLRYYTQDAANFYSHHLVQGVDVDAGGNVLVKYASNDYRLAKSTTSTTGMKYGMVMSRESELGFRVELITQKVDNTGVPAGEETPDLKAVVLQANYSLLW